MIKKNHHILILAFILLLNQYLNEYLNQNIIFEKERDALVSYVPTSEEIRRISSLIMNNIPDQTFSSFFF